MMLLDFSTFGVHPDIRFLVPAFRTLAEIPRSQLRKRRRKRNC
jgi:hypothetical protein